MIHYKNGGWIFNDLHKFITEEGFGDPSGWDEDIDFDRHDISMAIAYCVLKLGLALLRDLAKFTKKLSPEIQILSDCIGNGRHPIYGELLRA